MSEEVWKLTLPCTRVEAEDLAGYIEIFPDEGPHPVLVTSEPDPAEPERWQLDAYFQGKPSRQLLKQVAALIPSARNREIRARPLPPENWIARSQDGFDPVCAGRFAVRTPENSVVAGKTNLVIPAGLAFGTGQHATTRGCLEALDRLKQRGRMYRNVVDIGTGTGLLALASRILWPAADIMASDIDPLSITVARANAERNAIGRICYVIADGLAHRSLASNAPFDLVIANILAAPLVAMSRDIAAVLAGGGTLILAGLLGSQAGGVTRAFRRHGLRLVVDGAGEWPVLVMQKRPAVMISAGSGRV